VTSPVATSFEPVPLLAHQVDGCNPDRPRHEQARSLGLARVWLWPEHLRFRVQDETDQFLAVRGDLDGVRVVASRLAR